VLDTGTVAVLTGREMAAGDTFEITVRGRGGHAALPHETVDPVAIAAQLVTALQQVVSREIDPLETAVVSVTRIAGGSADNVIPESVVIGGTARTFDPGLRLALRESIERVARGITEAHGAGYDFRWTEGYAAVVNDPEIAALVADVARDLLGPAGVVEVPPLMAGDDFSAYLQRAPGAYALLGTRSARAGSVYPHHHPRFTIDEAALPAGVALHVGCALALLARRPHG
jgi:amidohydrolase